MSEFLSSKDLVTRHLGVYDIHAYEEVKRLYMKLGATLPRVLLERVGGREAYHGECCDGVTHLGKWEFCLQKNTKNAAGAKSDLLRCPGRCVQILGHPNQGWISGEDFLSLHGVDRADFLHIVNDVTSALILESRQMRLPI